MNLTKNVKVCFNCWKVSVLCRKKMVDYVFRTPE
jgi:hypothetical protein